MKQSLKDKLDLMWLLICAIIISSAYLFTLYRVMGVECEKQKLELIKK